MDNLELNEFLKKEFIENPMLDECGKKHDEEICIFAEDDKNYWGKSENYTDDSDTGIHKDLTGVSSSESESVKDFVSAQIDWKSMPEHERKIAEYAVECIEDTGFLFESSAEISARLNASVNDVDCVLEKLKNLNPPGIFSQTVGESLIRQLAAKNEDTPVMRRLIEEYLDDIAEMKIANISRGMGITTVEARKNIEIITNLRPYPLSGIGGTTAEYIIPDVVLTKDDGKWIIRLNDRQMQEYSLNDYYLGLIEKTTDIELKRYFRERLGRAKFILECIEQRRKTILKIAGTVLKTQLDFFEGKCLLHPMTMSWVSEEIGVNQSTVSRAVKNKYLQYPGGIISMKELFSSSAYSSGEITLTPEMIQKMIKNAISTEDPHKPLSDSGLEKMFKEKGIEIPRRTIAKYREEIGITSSYLRKK